MVSETTKLAVLIDADNAQPSAVPSLLAEVTKYGTTFVRRAYGDWTGTSLRGWKEQLLTHSIQPIQQFAYTHGKNATDSAMIIDAMDLLYNNRLDGFCIVSSDSDFTRLASRIRESGLVVYGVGEEKTPKPFVSACDKFIYVENILKHEHLATPHAATEATASTGTASTSTASTSTAGTIAASTSTASTSTAQPVALWSGPQLMDHVEPQLASQLRRAVEAASDEGGWASLGKVGSLITKQHSDFDPRTYGYTKLGHLVAATGLFDINWRSPAEGKQVVMYVRERRSKTSNTAF